MTPTYVRSLCFALAAMASFGCANATTPDTVMVRANEYAFTAPDSLPAGATAFGLANGGKVAHEIIIVRLRPEADLQEILRLDRAGSTWSALRDAPSGILTAGNGSQLNLSGGGLKAAATREVCDKVLSQGKSML